MASTCLGSLEAETVTFCACLCFVPLPELHKREAGATYTHLSVPKVVLFPLVVQQLPKKKTNRLVHKRTCLGF